MRICVACRVDQRTVVRIGSWGVPHGTPGHQVNYRWSSLFACPQCATGLLVHFDHDCFHQPWEEPWDIHWSWPVAVDGVQQLNVLLPGVRSRCSRRASALCTGRCGTASRERRHVRFR